MRGAWATIRTGQRNGTLSTGVTARLGERTCLRRHGLGSQFCKRDGVTMLVWCGQHGRIEDACPRETRLT